MQALSGAFAWVCTDASAAEVTALLQPLRSSKVSECLLRPRLAMPCSVTRRQLHPIQYHCCQQHVVQPCGLHWHERQSVQSPQRYSDLHVLV